MYYHVMIHFIVFDIDAPALMIKFKTNNFNQKLEKHMLSTKTSFTDSQYYNATLTFTPLEI